MKYAGVKANLAANLELAFKLHTENNVGKNTFGYFLRTYTFAKIKPIFLICSGH